MDYENYQYQIPEHARALMSEPSTYPEFASEAAALINEYVRKYKPPYGVDHVNELFIRILLNWERKTQKPVPPLHRDYWIKFTLGIIPRDLEYEKSTLSI